MPLNRRDFLAESFDEMPLRLVRGCAGTTPEMRNQDRGFQHVPQLEFSAAKHRDHFLCGMGHGNPETPRASRWRLTWTDGTDRAATSPLSQII
ncbi:MAG TPA: hypothetical protein VK828_10640 [Terriglobales bacterium]|jgi:hypothetical protein|nr:hypothetical protein [Terriglobales bacterium]